jgi:hypothetical protein
MSAEDAKSLKFQVVVDHTTAEQAKRVIREITVEVGRLVTEMNKASGFGGLFGGAGQRLVASGHGSSSPMAGPRAPSGAASAGGASNPLTAALLDNKNLLRGVSYESRDAMRVMSDAVKSGIGHQRAEVERLRGEISKLAAEYKQLGVVGDNAFRTGRVSDAIEAARGRSDVGQRFVKQSAQLGRAEGGLSSLEDLQAGGGIRGGLRAINQGNFGQGAQMIYASPTARGIGMAVATAQIVGATAMAVNNESLKNDFYTRGARAGSSVGSMSFGIRRGNLAEQQALQKLFSTGEAQQALGHGAPSPSGNERSAGGFGEYVLNRATNFFNPSDQTAARRRAALTGTLGANGSILGAANPTTLMQRGLDYQRAIGNIPVEEMERLRELASQRVQMDPRGSAYLNEFSGEYGSRMALMRAAGVGENRAERDPRTGQKFNIVNGATGKSMRGQLHNGAMDLGYGTDFDRNEVAGMMARLSATAGRGARFAASGVLPYTAGGLSNAPELYGMANQYGHGGRFLGALSGGANGPGGLDVTAAGMIGQMVTGDMSMGGSAGIQGTQGRAALEGFMSASRGGSAGADMRGARLMNQGVGAYNSLVLGGGMDPLQKGINVLASVRAAPNASVYARHYLEGLSATDQAGIIRSGKKTLGMSDRGLGVGDVEKYASEQQKLLFSRYMTGTGQGGSDTDAAVAGVRQKGLAGYFRGLKPGDRAGKIRLLGEAMADSSGGQMSEGGGEASIKAALSAYKDLYPTLKGTGIGDPAHGSLEAQAKRAADVANADKESFYRESRNEVSVLLSTQKQWAEAVGGFSTSLKQESDAFVNAVDRMIKAMDSFSGGRAGNAPRPPRAGAPGGR